MKKQYRVSFSAMMDEEDIKAIKNCFNDIDDCTDLQIEEETENENAWNTISLKVDDYKLDDKNGTLIVDKSVFDDFIQNAIIFVHFPDENGEPTYEYQMVREDEDYIYMEYFG